MIVVKFLSKEHLGDDFYTFHFTCDRAIRFIPGQFIELTLPHAADDRAERRWFTLSSTPKEGLAITTRIVTDSPSSFKRVLSELTPGTKLKMANPMGDFVLPKDPSIPLVFVAGGIGCTPFRSIIRSLQESGEKRDIRLLHSVSRKNSAIFLDIFEKLGQNFTLHVSERDGHLTSSDILAFSRKDDREYFYISGPEPMVEQLEKKLLEQGIKKSHLHGDFFPGYFTF